jgi:hypothetical protein
MGTAFAIAANRHAPTTSLDQGARNATRLGATSAAAHTIAMHAAQVVGRRGKLSRK